MLVVGVGEICVGQFVLLLDTSGGASPGNNIWLRTSRKKYVSPGKDSSKAPN